ncbi:carbon storage regulator [Neiella sp. HB171785]|uniref:Carbon storage regulator n=1 Tax=Neiella litorisoli TaxID=2771431 RepID=A0A8J6R2R8_9GAMM|nr:carbon storage regulator [Neiella litorisoli]MBD1389395.1 carbon storage regulator [Neiella litorisoli]
MTVIQRVLLRRTEQLIITPSETNSFNPLTVTVLPGEGGKLCVAVSAHSNTFALASAAWRPNGADNNLLINRNYGQSVIVLPHANRPIKVAILEREARAARLGFNADKNVEIWRTEIGLKRLRDSLLGRVTQYIESNCNDTQLIEQCEQYGVIEDLTSKNRTGFRRELRRSHG